MSIDQEFVEFVIKSLVTKPDEVQIVRRIDEKGVLLELTVDPEDLGRVIGKRGVTAQSVRTLLRALGTKNDARYNLKIVDNGVGGHSLERQQPDQSNQGSWGEDSSTSDSASQDASQVDEVAVEDRQEESDMAARTRRELRDLDDLDV